jgi:Arc/MetJ family transcription regulator
MRTTLDIDDDVLAAAIELASGQRTTAGKVISGLARRALAGPAGQSDPEGQAAAGQEEQKFCISFRLMSAAALVITPGTAGKLPEDDTCLG